jgi:hypothetical protein
MDGVVVHCGLWKDDHPYDGESISDEIDATPWPLQSTAAAEDDVREDPTYSTTEVEKSKLSSNQVSTTTTKAPSSKVVAAVVTQTSSDEKHDISSPLSSADISDADGDGDESSGGDILTSQDYVYHHRSPADHDHISICITDIE